MARYSASAKHHSTVTLTAPFPHCEIIASSTGRCSITDICVTSTLGSPSVGRGSVTSVPLLSSLYKFMPLDPADPASFTRLATAWTTAPSAPSQFFRRFSGANLNGQGCMFTFPRGIKVPAGGSIVVWDLGSSTVPVQNSSSITVGIEE